MGLRWGKASDVGRVRKNNQDFAYADGRIFVVADGMGGANGGEIASRLAVESFKSYATWAQDLEGLKSALTESNLAVYQKSLDDQGLSGMGTTFVALVALGSGPSSHAYVLNVGDSRAYVFRNGEMTQITEDHSWVGELFRSGRMSLDEAAQSANRHVLTRAIGVGPDVDIDVWDFIVSAGDRILLCSDGVTNELSDPQIAAVLARIGDPQQACEEIVKLSLESGGIDNVSCVLVDFGGEYPGADAVGAQSASGRPEEIARVMPVAIPMHPIRISSQGPNLTSIPVPISKGEFTKSGNLLRIAAFLLTLILIFGVGIYAVGKYVRGSYYVGVVKGGSIAIYQGRPGGLLWFSPHVVSVRALSVSSLPSSYAIGLHQGVDEPNYSAALTYVRNLESVAAQFRAAGNLGGATTTTTSTATTIASSTTKVG